MCRFIAYMGTPLVLNELILKPTNSLINQSVHARESSTVLNADGFGVGWYSKELDEKPGLFRSIQPAWNDENLKYLASKIRSKCIFAHARAASLGHVSQDNCHPFHYDKFLFMHNGDILGFDKIKRVLRRNLSDESYKIIQGQTDSEHFFALLMDNFLKSNLVFNEKTAAEILIKSINEVEMMKKAQHILEPTLLNAVITDGEHIVAVRYLSNLTAKPNSLYYAVGEKYECAEGVSDIKKGGEYKHNVIIVTSEPLNDKHEQWHEIPLNHVLIVGKDLSMSIKSIE